MIPNIDIVVSKHANLYTYALQAGFIREGTPHFDRADKRMVEGKNVLGLLPLHLAAHAATVTEVPLRPAPEGIEPYSIWHWRKCAGKPTTYRVLDRWHPAEQFEVAREPSPLHPNDEVLRGGDRRASKRWWVQPMDLRFDISFHSNAYDTYRDGGSWTLVGEIELDPQAWSEGRVRRGYKPLAPDDDRPEPVTAAIGIVAGVDWMDISEHYAGKRESVGRPVAPMQREPLVVIRHPVDGDRFFRLRWVARDSKGRPLSRCVVGLDYFADDSEWSEGERDLMKSVRASMSA